MTNRAGRAAIIAASFGVQALIFAGVAGLATTGSHTEIGYAAPQGVSRATLLPLDAPMMIRPMVISMSTEGQQAHAFIANPHEPASLMPASPAAPLQLTPHVAADLTITVSTPQGYPLYPYTFGITPFGAKGINLPVPVRPLLAVSEPGTGLRTYILRLPAATREPGYWGLVMSVEQDGATSESLIAQIVTR